METDHADKYLRKYDALERYFVLLQEETEEVSNQLQRAKEAKRMLQAEVRFLRNRAKLLRATASKSDRVQDAYFVSDSGDLVTSQASSGNMLMDGEMGTKASKNRVTKPSGKSSKSQSVMGASVKSTKKQVANNKFAPTKKSKGGSSKRKISWQDDMLIHL